MEERSRCPTLFVPRRREMNWREESPGQFFLAFFSVARTLAVGEKRVEMVGRRRAGVPGWLAMGSISLITNSRVRGCIWMVSFRNTLFCQSLSSSIGSSIGPLSTWIILDHWIFLSFWGSVVFQIPWHLEATRIGPGKVQGKRKEVSAFVKERKVRECGRCPGKGSLAKKRIVHAGFQSSRFDG